MEITKSLCAISAEVGGLAKNKKNEKLGYTFRGVDDLMNALHPLLAKYGVLVIPEVISSSREERVTASGGSLLSTVLTIKYHFTAVDGSEICATVIGEGMDSGDKASNKAMAVAFKYACFQVFCIPTQEIAKADPDNFSPDSSRALARVVKERLLNCGSLDDLKSIANDYGSAIQQDESLFALYRAVKAKFMKGGPK